MGGALKFSALWQRIPVIVRAVVVGMLAAAAGTYPWAWLASENMRHAPTIPWGAAVMAGYLCLYWMYATGRGWPAATAPARRENSRWRAVPGAVWGTAIIAGVLGLWFCVALLRFISRFVPAAAESTGDLSRLSPITIISLALMGALVAGVVEEISFRGYMQRPLERRYGPAAAVVITGVMFGLAHGTHSYWSLALMPYYVAVAGVYGGIAYLTDSILPSLVLHTAGDALDALFSVAAAVTGSGAGSTTAAPQSVPVTRPPVWINVLVLAATAAATIWAFRQLASHSHKERSPIPEAPRLD